MVKVLHLISTLAVGGAEAALSRVVMKMDRRRFCNVVVSMTSVGLFGDRLKDSGILVYTLGNKARPIPEMNSVTRFVSLVRHERPDIIHAWMYHASILSAACFPLYRRAALAWNVRNSFSMNESRYTILMARAAALLSRLPRSIVFNSQTGLRSHEAIHYSTQRARVIPNGFDTDRFCPAPSARERVRRQWGVNQNESVIGLIARLHPMKDHPAFLRAVSFILDDYPNTRFVCVGSGADEYRQYLQNASRSLGLDGRVIWIDECNDMPSLYNALDILCSSSAYGEGFSNVIGEAMACAVPCVATDVGDSRRIVGDAGVVVPPRDPEALAQGWRMLLSMPPEERKRLGEQARERIKANYSLEKCVREYESLYESLANNGR